MSIIISKNGKNAVRLRKSLIPREAYLQKYIYENPDVIPLDEIKDNVKLCILGREFPTSSGSIDAIGIDQDGEIYIIETKLYKNPDKRLVVAQVLDYGASLNNNNSFEDFIEFFEKESEKKFKTSLHQKLADFFKFSEDELSILFENLRRNLEEANFKFIILMDRLHSELKDLIVFLNRNSKFDIYAVELELYKYQDFEILIPDLYGSEVKKDFAVRQSIERRKKWDESGFFNELQNSLDEKYIEPIKKLYDFSKKAADHIKWGKGISRGSFNPKFNNISERSLFSVFTDGTLRINFGWLDDNDETIRIMKTFGKTLMKINDFAIPENYAETYVNIPIENWYSHVDEFIEIVKELIEYK